MVSVSRQMWGPIYNLTTTLGYSLKENLTTTSVNQALDELYLACTWP